MYHISIVQRGHVNARDKDIVVRFKGRIVDKLGYSRPYTNGYATVIDEKKLMRWVYHGNVVYSKGFLRLMAKLSLGFTDFSC